MNFRIPIKISRLNGKDEVTFEIKNKSTKKKILYD